MPDLILRPSGLPSEKGKPWALQLRYHDCCGPTDYSTIAHVSDDTAREIMRAGEPFWLYGDPDEAPARKPAAQDAAPSLSRVNGRGE